MSTNNICFYIGAAIDSSGDDPTINFKELISVITEVDPSAVIFNPLTAYVGAGGVSSKNATDFVKSINDFSIRHCDFAVFIWDKNPSFGVPMEISLCASEGIKFAVWNKSGKKAGIYLLNTVESLGSEGVILDKREDLVVYLSRLLSVEKHNS